MFSCEFCEISNNIFFDRTPLVAASEHFGTKLFHKANTKLTRTDFCDLFVIAKNVFAILHKFVSVAASKWKSN